MRSASSRMAGRVASEVVLGQGVRGGGQGEGARTVFEGDNSMRILPIVPGAGIGRVTWTPTAAELLVRLTHLHGPLMFHQSGGCCDGSSPMCCPDGDFRVGGSDVHLGDLAVPGLTTPTGFYMSSSQFEY